MKQHRFLLFLFLVIGSASCKENPCEGVVCVEGGCQAGVCVCNEGFEGAGCETEMREKFIGGWDAGEICNAGANTFPVQVKRGEGIREIFVHNLFQQEDSVLATVSGLDVEIPLQAFGVWTIEGGGQIDTAARPVSLNLDYHIDYGGGAGQDCLASMTPQ